MDPNLGGSTETDLPDLVFDPFHGVLAFETQPWELENRGWKPVESMVFSFQLVSNT